MRGEIRQKVVKDERDKNNIQRGLEADEDKRVGRIEHSSDTTSCLDTVSMTRPYRIPELFSLVIAELPLVKGIDT